MKKTQMADNHKEELQKAVNKLARMIDGLFYKDCICCGKPFGQQSDGAHFHSVGSRPALRYNLHNVHKARTFCNKYSDKHKQGYEEGLRNRYDNEYFAGINEVMPMKYQTLKLTPEEVKEALKRARKLIREFDSYEWKDGIQARSEINKIIGIYH